MVCVSMIPLKCPEIIFRMNEYRKSCKTWSLHFLSSISSIVPYLTRIRIWLQNLCWNYPDLGKFLPLIILPIRTLKFYMHISKKSGSYLHQKPETFYIRIQNLAFPDTEIYRTYQKTVEWLSPLLFLSNKIFLICINFWYISKKEPWTFFSRLNDKIKLKQRRRQSL